MPLLDATMIMIYHKMREREKMIDYEYILTDAEYWEQERNHLVVKHNSLIQKTRYSLTTQQQKVLLYTISKIQPGDDDFKERI